MPFAVLLAMLVTAAVIFLSSRKPAAPSRVVLGTPPPAAQASSSSGLQPVAPGVDEAAGVFTIQPGDVVVSNGVQFGVTSVTTPPAGEAGRQPSQGQFMQVDVEVHNAAGAGDQPFAISSATDFELRDGAGQSYPATASIGTAKPPDGNLAPGTTLEGSLTYDVPTGRSFWLVFKNPLISNGAIVVELGKH